MAGTYAFVDGNYLNARFGHQMDTFYGVVPPINFDAIRQFLGAERLFYYDAIDYTQDDKEKDSDYHARIGTRESLHAYINSRTGWHVREGHVRRAKQQKKREQKGVDILLSVDAMKHAARGNMNTAVLLAGDLDFEPLVQSLLRLGVPTRLIYSPTNVSDLLKAAADDRHKMTLQQFYAWSPYSFRTNYREVRLAYETGEPPLSVFTQVREGRWDDRRVRLFRPGPNNTSNGTLFVDAGDELRQVSLTMEYVDVDRLPLAFELTFGDVDWL